MSITRQEIDRTLRRGLDLHWDHLGATTTSLQELKFDLKIDPEHGRVRHFKLVSVFDDVVPVDTTRFTFSS